MKTLDEQMLERAAQGYFFLYADLIQSQVDELVIRGFKVFDKDWEKAKKKIFPHLYQVSWLWTPLPDIGKGKYSSLNEHDPHYTFTQKLWIMAIKNVKKG